VSDNALIKVTDLKKHYNGGEVKALDGVNCEIEKGEVVVVISPPLEDDISCIDIEKELKTELEKSTLKDAVKKISEKYKIKKNDVYEKALRIKNDSL
jgi:polar amino acid transport system ATP-binding protein